MTDDILHPDEGDDQPLEPRLLEAARAWHPPPATPREAMWARIAEARRGTPVADGGPGEPAVPVAPRFADPQVIPIDAARGRRRQARSWGLLAAGLAAGIALGVFGADYLRQRGETGSVVATSPDRGRDSVGTDSGPASGPQVAAAESGVGKPVVDPEAQRGTLPGGEPMRVADSRSGNSRSGNSRSADSRAGGAPPTGNIAPNSRRAGTDVPRAPSRGAADPAPLYHAAAVQTLAQAEALLVSWRVDAPRDTASARQLGAWARDVLGSTRLLLDSPVGDDPRLHDLLDDLELVLAQIVQLSGAPLTAEERALLERSLRARDLLPRLRSAVPAGAAST